MTKDITESFLEKIDECDRHVQKIGIAKKHLDNFFPLQQDDYSKEDEIRDSFLDQLVFRYIKLQDTMGESLYPMILTLGKEDIKRKTFLDILNRLEELELVEKKQWLKLRELRNEIAHEYSNNPDETITNLNLIYSSADDLIRRYGEIKEFCKKRYSLELN